ncbi:cell adhesion molecule 3-like [Carassius carassius]|uniref:cell adhesion molecule 3-like n=1 Tax=Carassius carassius TaxID=217509 RepID=UPI002868A3A6|nr:cell adhesion molecule 3-like [Carassius carassius]
MFVNIMVCPALLLQCFIWISLMAKGVQNEVTHIVSRMCVVRQSTVLIPCKHTSPSKQVRAAEWLYEKSPEQKVRVSQDPAFEGRVESVQPHTGNCSLLLRDVRKSDAGIFRFVLSTASGRNLTNNQGIQLEVTDAELEVKTESDVVMEGDLIMFVCGSCIPSMTVPTYIWKKDGQLHSQHHGDNILVLESVELKDGGRYSCSLSSHEGLRSTSVEVTVRPGYAAEESRSALIWVVGGISAAVVLMSVILMVFIGLLIRRKRATPSEEQNPRGSAHSKTPGAPEDTYMTLDPKSRCSEYDTLDNMKRSSENTDDPAAQEATYEDIDN